METYSRIGLYWEYISVILGSYRDIVKENGNHYSRIGLYRGNIWVVLGLYRDNGR